MKKAILQIFTAILALGLFCGAAAAAPSILGTPTPSQNTTVTGTVGGTQPFTITLNQTATVTWTVNGNSTPTNTDSNNIATFNHVIQSGSYQVTAALPEVGQIAVWNVMGTAGAPVITLSDPSQSSVSNNMGELRTFTATVSQISNVTWYLDNANVQTNNSVTQSSYTTSSPAQGPHTIRVDAQNENGAANSKSWTWTVNDQSANNTTGRRIWQEGMSKTYMWNAQSFSGFYYDLDSGFSSEEMTIQNIDRSIDSGDIEYVTKPTETKFEHNNWGTYQLIGFMAEKYFAGYTKEGSKVIGDDISPISNGILSKILLDNDDKKSVSSQDSLALEEGYTLVIKEVNINGNSVWVQLEKDGKVVDDEFVSSDGDFVYETDLGKATKVPLIIVHFGTVFHGAENDAVFVQGMFQVSSNYQEVKDGDNFGEMEVTSISSDRIAMENSDNVGLDKGETVDLMGKIKIKVADDTTLRFAPIVDTSEAGTYELRGTVYDEKINGATLPKWDPFNFEGFYYNIDEGIGTENLTVNKLTGSTIPTDELVYESKPQPVNFEHNNWGNFTVVGFMADKYFAGYPDNAVNGSVDRVSLLSSGILSKILTDSDDKESMSQGSALALQEGYSLSIKEVDVNGKSVWVQLEKDGSVVDDEIVTSGNNFVYKTDIGKATKVPLIIVHFGTVFSGAENSAVFVQGIFQISDEYTEINDGDTFGEMEVTGVSESGITMKNTDSIGLDKGEDTSIMGNVSFKTADASTLRFYPFVKVEGSGGSSANGLNISAPDEIFAGSAFDITVTAGGNPVEGVTVKVNGNSTGTTSADGIVQYTAENTGALKLTAEKKGYSTASKNVNVVPPKEEMSLSISPETVYIGDNITIAALKKIGGNPIESANVSIDGQSLGATGSDGKINYKTVKNGTIKVSATKDGFNDNSIDVMVKDLAPIFTVSNLTVNPMEVSAGKNTTISAIIENTGNAAGKYNASLSINGNVTNSKEVSIDVGRNATVTFSHSEEKPGNYTAVLGEQTVTYKVKESSPILLYVLGAVILLLIGGAAYYFTKGGGDIGTLQEKVQELISSIKLKK